MVHYNKLVRRINREEELFHVKDYYVKLCYSYMELVKVNLYYVYTMEVVQMIYHVKVEVVKMIYHVEVYHVEVYCEVDYYKVDNWVQKVEILVLGKMMGNVSMVDGFAGCFLSQLGEGHVVQEEDDILEERFPFLNLRSRDVADTASLLECIGYLVKQRWVEHSQEGMELLLLVENPANRDGTCSVAKYWNGN